MRVKIRGLVFVGFAAAVFAQSAMADPTTDAKTVTSKLYVDSKVEGVTETGSGANLTYGDTTIDENSPNDKAPSALNVYKFVTDTVGDAAVTIQGDNTYTTASNNNGTWTVGIDTTKLGTTSNITSNTNTERLTTVGAVRGLLDTSLSDATSGSDAENDTTVPTSAAVVSYAEKKGNKLDGNDNNTIAQFYNSPTKYPSAKAVYDFVTTQGGNFQPKAPTTDGTSLYLGHNTVDGTNNIADWKKLEAVATGAQSSTDYVTIKEDSGVYKINIPSGQVGTVIGDITNNGTKLATGKAVYSLLQTAGSGTDATTINSTNATGTDGDKKVPTVKNVYNFVTGAISAAGESYQPKIENTSTGKVMIGYNTATTSGSDTTYSSGWRELVGDYTMQNNVYEGGYIEVAPNPEISNLAEVRLLNVGHAGSAISSATAADAMAGKDKLASAYAVKEYVTGLTGGLTIPEPTGDCEYGANGITSTNGVACALVLSYSASANDNAGGVALEWIPMAQTVSSNP